jgi:hypothetical protein
MFLKTLSGGAVLVCGVLAATGLHSPPHNGCPGARLLALTCASAGEKTDDKAALSGTWGKKDAELKIAFADKGVMKILLHGDNADKLIAVVCECTVEKKGLVGARVSGFEGKEEIKKAVAEKLPVGLRFRFKWTAKGNAARLEDLTGDKVPEIFKTHLEGDFEKK